MGRLGLKREGSKRPSRACSALVPIYQASKILVPGEKPHHVYLPLEKQRSVSSPLSLFLGVGSTLASLPFGVFAFGSLLRQVPGWAWVTVPAVLPKPFGVPAKHTWHPAQKWPLSPLLARQRSESHDFTHFRSPDFRVALGTDPEQIAEDCMKGHSTSCFVHSGPRPGSVTRAGFFCHSVSPAR